MIFICFVIVVFVVYLNESTNFEIFNEEYLEADAAVKIEFDQFLEFYHIDKSVWELKEKGVIKIDSKNRKTYQIQFSYVDYKRYLRFFKHIEKNKETEKGYKDMAEFLGSVQRDINTSYDKLSRMLKERKK